MKKFITLSLTLLLSALTALADGEAMIPAAINSRIFSTQNAQPLDTIERSHYTNSSIYQLESKNKSDIQQQIQDKNDISVSDKKKKGGFFEGFRVIW